MSAPITDGRVVLDPPMPVAPVALEDVQREIEAVRHIVTTRMRELASDVAQARAENASTRDCVGRVEGMVTELGDRIVHIDRVIVPAGRSAVVAGIAVGVALGALTMGAMLGGAS